MVVKPDSPLATALLRLSDPGRGEIVVPWRVVRYGRRLVDLEEGPTPELFNVYHEAALARRAALDDFLGRAAALGVPPHVFWAALQRCGPLGAASRDVREALGFDAREALELFVSLVVSGLPFTEAQERGVLECMRSVLRAVFPASSDVLGEDLTDPARVPERTFAALDACCDGQGLSARYVLRTTLCFTRYSYDEVLAALQGERG